jgi:hypothetical protein
LAGGAGQAAEELLAGLRADLARLAAPPPGPLPHPRKGPGGGDVGAGDEVGRMDLARPELNLTWRAWADAVRAAREGGAGSDAGRMRLSVPGLRRRPALAQVLDR